VKRCSLLIYQEAASFHSGITSSQSSLKHQSFQRDRDSCPANNSAGIHSAIQYNSKKKGGEMGTVIGVLVVIALVFAIIYLHQRT